MRVTEVPALVRVDASWIDGELELLDGRVGRIPCELQVDLERIDRLKDDASQERVAGGIVAQAFTCRATLAR
jgi:hypothetical protein